MDSSRVAQKEWAKTPLWKQAELLHCAAALLKEHKNPIAECLVKEIAKPAKDVVTEVSISILLFFIHGLLAHFFAILKFGIVCGVGLRFT